MNGKIISSCPGGLCNRLKCLVSCSRIAKKYNRELLLYWPENLACGAKFNDLFEDKIKSISTKDLERLEKEKNYFFYSDKNNLILPNKEKEVITDTWRFCLFEEEISKNFSMEVPPKIGESIDFEYARIPKKMRKKITSTLLKLKIKDSILDRVLDFSKKNKIYNCIGLHIRRGDITNSRDGWGKISDEEKFIARIREILCKNNNQKFFLATDSYQTEKRLLALFKENLIVYPKEVVERNKKNSIIESLIELLLLSKTKKIIGTYQSTYTELAWWLGGADKDVEILGTEEEKLDLKNNRAKNEKRLVIRIKKTILRIFGKYPLFYRKEYSIGHIWD